MTPSQRDIWSEWLLERRFGGSAERMKAALDYLYPVRDKVLLYANLGENQTLLDVGCGDGLIGFGALEKSKTGKVLFTDISQELLDRSRMIAQEMDLLSRCEFIRASADALSAIVNELVDVVTTRSVLIYVAEKQQAFCEFYRVLKPAGRLSIFEPINSFAYPEPRGVFSGFDVTPITEIAEKVKAVACKLQPPGLDPMLDFDERKLVEFAESAGFKEVHLELQIEIKPESFPMDWETWLHIAPNPKLPNLQEAMQQVLTPDEREILVRYLRPLVESKKPITKKSAVAYLWAVK